VGVVSPSTAPGPVVLDEVSALRAGRSRRLGEVGRRPYLAPDIQRITEEIARLEREARKDCRP
jgi:hypothetical protein